MGSFKRFWTRIDHVFTGCPVEGRLTFKHYPDFAQCKACGRVFYKGLAA